ncbi:MAG TPA: helix-turn-helix transcriptional regulator [Lacisediminihabitans sp.]|uniref:helix-turn-helix domain-containing protein n=1 Tax=Lacisediminihabitans sp. TaxID=2787631 RepID=UPI002ED7B150
MTQLGKSTLRTARLARGIGVRELARRMNVTPGAVSQWERSEANNTIQLNTLNRALTALRGVSQTRPATSDVYEPAPFEHREERVSFELHRAIAKKLIDAPSTVRAAIPEGIARIRSNVHGPLAKKWLDEWLRLSTGSVGELIDVLLGTDEHSIEMRQNSPFLTVLSQDDRLEAITRAIS